MPNPWQARRWREQGSEGAYADMSPDARPDAPQPPPERALHSVPELRELDPETPHDYPAEGNVEAVLAWVARSPDRAAYASAVERMRAEPRRTVLGPLQRLLDA